MAIKYTITKYGVSFPTKVAASAGSPHIYNITLTTFELEVKGQATNGNWYVEVKSVDASADVLYIHMPVIIAENFTRKFADEKNFYLPAGTVAKAYTLIRGDILEYSEECFSATPTVGATITACNATTGKLTI